jgi:hypothetical protein
MHAGLRDRENRAIWNDHSVGLLDKTTGMMAQAQAIRRFRRGAS